MIIKKHHINENLKLGKAVLLVDVKEKWNSQHTVGLEVAGLILSFPVIVELF